jgi:ribose-phosphate pyrophosphokinase
MRGRFRVFFDIPVDHLYATPVIYNFLKDKYRGEECTFVSPDAGGVERARAIANRMNSGLAIVDKRRSGPNQAKAFNLIGEVEGKTAIIVDDIIDTAGTLCEAAELLRKRGATQIIACASHGVFSGPAAERLLGSSLIEQVVVTDTIPLSAQLKSDKKFVVLSVAALLAEAISRIHHHESVSSLFI